MPTRGPTSPKMGTRRVLVHTASRIYKFVKSVAFSAEEKSRDKSEEWKAMRVVDEEQLVQLSYSLNSLKGGLYRGLYRGLL